MPINGATISDGATCSVSGGTAKTYTPNGARVSNGTQVADASVTDLRIQPTITVKNNPARILPDNTWSNAKREAVITRPKLIASGLTKFPNIRISATLHPEMTQAEINELRYQAAQLLFDTDFANFWLAGSTA